jgi:Flp pilus assembly protein TadB
MRQLGLGSVRYGLPAAMAIAGIVALFVGGTGAGLGVVLIGFALMVLLINVLFRVSIVSNREREEEERARDTFERTGRWPGE